MAARVWKVVADYLDGPNYSVFFQEPAWMDYMKQKAEKPKGKAPESIKKMIKEKGLSEPFPAYNPYDYQSPTDKPKDLKDGPPFQNEFPNYPINPPHAEFNRGKVFSPGGVMDYKYKTRNQDWTQDPSEQYPAISIDRKYASDEQVKRVVAGYLLQHMPLVLNPEDFDDFGAYIKTAASLNEIISKDFHYKNDEKINRAEQCSVKRLNRPSEIEQGMIRYHVNCTGSPDTHTVVFQFMRDKTGRRPDTYADYPVQIACSCESFLFYGAQYYAVQGEYMYMPRFRRSLVPPTPHEQISSTEGNRLNPGRGLNFRVCKHILACYNQIKGMRITKYYRNYPEIGAPSKIMNKEQWKKLLKFEFTKENIVKRLTSSKPKIPAYYSSKNIKPELNKWFREVYVPRTEDEKIKILETLVEHPEEIFFLAIKDAYFRQGNLSKRYVDKVYDLLSKVIMPESDQEPRQEKMEGVPEEQQEVGKGTGMVIPDVENILSERVEGEFDESMIKDIETEIENINPELKGDKKEQAIETIKSQLIDGLAKEIEDELKKPYATTPQEKIDNKLKKITPTSIRRKIWKSIQQNGLQQILGEL